MKVKPPQSQLYHCPTPTIRTELVGFNMLKPFLINEIMNIPATFSSSAAISSAEAIFLEHKHPVACTVNRTN